jgi:hypothetical protein
MWLVLLAVLLATVATLAYGPLVTGVVALALFIAAVAGTLRQAIWGITSAQAFCWLALVMSFALAIGDPEEPTGRSLAELFLRREVSLTEASVGVALAVAPWLICLHFLGLQKRALKVRALGA